MAHACLGAHINGRNKGICHICHKWRKCSFLGGGSAPRPPGSLRLLLGHLGRLQRDAVEPGPVALALVFEATLFEAWRSRVAESTVISILPVSICEMAVFLACDGCDGYAFIHRLDARARVNTRAYTAYKGRSVTTVTSGGNAQFCVFQHRFRHEGSAGSPSSRSSGRSAMPWNIVPSRSCSCLTRISQRG
jgi:hypothetical protein